MLDGLSRTWPSNPESIVLLLILVVLYLLGIWRVRVRYPQDTSITLFRLLSFFSAILVAALLLLTPIDTIGRTQLFSVHMFELVVLTTLCTPLLMFGCPAILLQPLVEMPVVRDVIRLLTRPLVASILFNLVFLFWHAPRVFNAVMTNESLYHVAILSIFLVSLLNWFPLIGSVDELRNMSYPTQMFYAFVDGQPVDIFAFVLVFAGVSLYPLYTIPPIMSLSPFSDQAVAGALLLLPGIIDFVVMTPLFFRWLGEIEQRTKLADQRRQEQAELEEDEWEEYEEDEDGIAANAANVNHL